MIVMASRAMRVLHLMTKGKTMETMTAAVIKGNKRIAYLVRRQEGFWLHLVSQCAVSTVFLTASRLRRVRLVVRTQPSQGWYTGSTPVRAAIILKQVRALNDPLIIEAI